MTNQKQEEKQLIAALHPFAYEDRLRSWMHVLITLAVWVVAYAGIYYFTEVWIRIIFSVFAGLTAGRLFVIYHDYLHKNILSNSFVADIIFTLFGMYMLAPKSIWKRSHDYHHKHNSKLYSSSIGSFPVVTKKKFLDASKRDRNIYLFIRHPLTIMFGYIFAFAYGMCIASFLSSKSKHWDSLVALILHYGIGVMLLVVFGWQIFLFAFMIPVLISGGLGAYLFYAQHNFPGAKFRTNKDWCYEHAALESSSYMAMNRFMQWATANIGFHHIHHINSKIPFYRLPEVMADIPALQKVTITRLTPSHIFNCLRLKVWDASQNKMISLAEIS
jgi:omega-6 fatty acid desaturase (delta-12 desaturase)